MKTTKHSHGPAHFVTGMAVVAAGAASTLATTYILSQADLPPDVRLVGMGIGATLTASLALMPLFLAPAYGDAIRGGKARMHLLSLTCVILAVDGALQMQAVSVVAKALGHDHINHLVAGILIAGFQLSTFFIRGKLIEAHHERKAAEMAQAIELEALQIKREKAKARRARDKRKKAQATGPKLVKTS